MNRYSLRKYFKKSFSQTGEDMIINHLYTGNINSFSYLDIGAFHPWKLNNTAFFYLQGAKGINIEPDPSLFLKFLKYRKRDINLNIGIGSENCSKDLYIMSTQTLNTFSEKEAANYCLEYGYTVKNKLEVDMYTIETIIEKYNGGEFPDFLSIDAEGLDFEILKTINFNKYYPKIICIETITFSETGKGKKRIEIINYLKEKGFILFADTFINSIFVSKEYWNKR